MVICIDSSYWHIFCCAKETLLCLDTLGKEINHITMIIPPPAPVTRTTFPSKRRSDAILIQSDLSVCFADLLWPTKEAPDWLFSEMFSFRKRAHLQKTPPGEFLQRYKMEVSGQFLAKCAMMFLAIFLCILSIAQAGLNSMEVGDMHAGEFDVKPGGSVHEFEQSWVCLFPILHLFLLSMWMCHVCLFPIGWWSPHQRINQ